MGAFGGLITIPINAFVSWWLKRNEQQFQHKLDLIAKQRELLLQHELEMKTKLLETELRHKELRFQHDLETERKAKDQEIAELKANISQLKKRSANG